MMQVRRTNQITYKVNFIVGVSLFVVGAVLVGLSIAFWGNFGARLGLSIAGGSLLFSGLVEMMIGLVFWVVTRKSIAKLARLKNEGVKYELENIQIKHRTGVQMGRHLSARVEGSYKDHGGQSHSVKSGAFLWNPNAKYSAVVFVNHNDSSDYAVEVSKVS